MLTEALAGSDPEVGWGLARLAGVSRYKICLHELGDGELTADEVARLEAALRRKAARVRRRVEQIERRLAMMTTRGDVTPGECLKWGEPVMVVQGGTPVSGGPDKETTLAPGARP